MQNAFLLACGLLLIGFILRTRLKILGRLFIPASVIGGLLGLVLVQCFNGREVRVGWLQEIADLYRSQWTSWLISVVFAGMLLERPGGSAKQNLRETAQQGIVAWIIILGQLVLGLTVTWLVLGPVFGVPLHLGQVLEVSWAGGFGSSTAWGNVHEQMKLFPAARDVALFGATSGMLFGVLSGIVLVNLAVRRGWTQGHGRDEGGRMKDEKGENERRTLNVQSSAGPPSSFILHPSSLPPQPAALALVSREVIDPLAFQVLLLAAALAAGWAMQQGVTRVAGLAPSDSVWYYLKELPLFLFTLLGGWVVRVIMQILGTAHLIDSLSMHRLTGGAMDFLIVAALTSLRVERLVTLLWPLTILLAIGAIWCIVTLVWLSPRLLPRRYWFELGLINYGFATATTAQGMMLLRMIDPELRTNAAKTYALAAPLTAPFIGGGIITYALPVLLVKVHVVWIILAFGVTTVALYELGRRLAGRETPSDGGAGQDLAGSAAAGERQNV